MRRKLLLLLALVFYWPDVSFILPAVRESCPGADERECHRRDRINNGDRIRNAHRDGNRI